MKTLSLVVLIALAACAWAEPRAPRLSNTDEALERYGELTGKTVLRPSVLPAVDAPSELAAFDMPEYRRRAPEEIIERFKRVGVIFKSLGEKFVLVVPQRATIDVPPPPPATAVASDQENPRLPKGTIKFPGSALDHVLDIYSLYRKRTILRPAGLPAATIHLRTGSGLTLEEAVYAMDVVLALNGIAVVDDGERFVQVVPWRWRLTWKQIRPNAIQATR